MNLTIAEFCRFNLKSRIQLLYKDGILLRERKVYTVYKVKIYKIYKFYVEVITVFNDGEVVRVDPVLNGRIIDMYKRT